VDMVVVVVVLQVLTTVERVYQRIVAQIVLMEVTLLLTNHLPLTTVTYMQTSDHEIHHCLLLSKGCKKFRFSGQFLKDARRLSIKTYSGYLGGSVFVLGTV
jgi:hypothetical protein